MKIVHIVPRISKAASGVASAAVGLCTHLSRAGHDVEMHVVEPASDFLAGMNFRVHVHPQWPVLTSKGVSTAMFKALRKSCGNADILHNNSLWMAANIVPAFVALPSTCKMVLSPHGTLSPTALNRSRLGKFFVWRLGQRAAVRKADCLHATGESEFRDIRHRRLSAPVAVIPHGVDIPRDLPPHGSGGETRRLLYFGRLHPIKGLEMLLECWKNLENRHPNWHLAIAGEDPYGYKQQLVVLSSRFSLKRVSFLPPAYGDERFVLYTSADLYVLPSFTENFGLTAAEAMASAVPVMVTSASPWENLEQKQCGWSVDPEPNALFKQLDHVMRLTESDLAKRGKSVREWMIRDYSWDAVTEKMIRTYEWLLGKCECPDWVEE